MPRYQIIILLALTLAARPLQGGPFRAGNLLVVNGERLHEYTRNGELVQSFPIPYPPASPRPPTEPVLGLVLTGDCRAAVFNGSFNPVLSILDPQAGTWKHLKRHQYWNTVGGVGGIASFQKYVYVTDFDLGSDPPTGAAGVIRYDLRDGSSQRFLPDQPLLDLAMRGDGTLYLLAGVKNIQVLDPSTMEVLREIRLPVDVLQFGVGPSGEIFALAGEHKVYHFDAEGKTLQTSITVPDQFSDIDVAFDGSLLLSERFGSVCLGDANFHCLRSFKTGEMSPRAAFIEPPPDECDLLPPQAQIVALVELPRTALVGRPASVQARLTRNGGLVREPVRFRLVASRAAVFAGEAAKGTLISGGGTSEVFLEADGGLARIDVTPSMPGEVTFRVEDTGELGIVLQGKIEEDFEATDGGFTHGGGLDEWKWGKPSSGPRRAHSGEKAWWTERTSVIAESTNSYLQTPAYELPPSAEQPVFLEFWHWFFIPAGRMGRGLLLASVDGGEYDWIPGVPEYLDSVGRYQFQRVPLALYAGHSVQFRFVFQLDAFARGSVWAIDTLRFTGLGDSLKALLPEGDEDRDGLSNLDEALRRTDASVPDSDSDGLGDGVETNSGRFVDPNDTGTDPLKADTDGGGMRDDQEVLRGLDPLLRGDDFQKLTQREVLDDAEGFRWNLDEDASILLATGGSLRDALKLAVNGRSFPRQPFILTSGDGRNRVFGPQLLEALEVTRDVFITSQGKGYCRSLEILRHTSDSEVEAMVRISGKVFGGTLLTLTTSSGDRTFVAGDHWVVAADRESGRGLPYVSLVASGPGALVGPSTAGMAIDGGTFHFSYNVRIPARRTVALLHFAAQSESESGALEKAKGLDLQSEGTSEELKRRVFNFKSLRDETKFHRGDLNNDGQSDISDGLCLLEFLFAGGPMTCREAADSNNDGQVNCTDAIVIMGYLFLGTDPPADPGPPGFPCGFDPDDPGSPFDLGCQSYAVCSGGR